MEINTFIKYHLSTDGFYFKYRFDKYDKQLVRATLFNNKNEIVDDKRVCFENEMTQKEHFKTINFFEARLLLTT